jgi:hypothetical protein
MEFCEIDPRGMILQQSPDVNGSSEAEAAPGLADSFESRKFDFFIFGSPEGLRSILDAAICRNRTGASSIPGSRSDILSHLDVERCSDFIENELRVEVVENSAVKSPRAVKIYFILSNAGTNKKTPLFVRHE